MVEFSVGTIWATFTSRTYNNDNSFSTGAWITPTLTPSLTPTGTLAPTNTPTLTPTPTITNTPTPSNTPTPTATLTPTITPSASPTPSQTPTPTITPTPSETPTPTLTPTTVPPVPSETGNFAVSLSSASTQYIDTGTGSSFNTLTTNATWEFWIKPSSITSGDHALLARWGSGTSRSWKLYLFDYSGGYYVSAYIFDTNDPSNLFTQNAYWLSNFQLNTWYHIAWVFDGSGITNADKLKLYVNGQQQILIFNGSAPVIPPLLNVPSAESVNIGSDGLSENYDGTIDNISIWNVSRTESAIYGDYLNELIGSETGLVAYYKFNEGVGGSTAYDRTSNRNDGTLINTPTWVGGYPQVVMNEMMVNPTPGPDWVEIYNRSNKTVDISGWTMLDSAPSDNIIGTVPVSTSLTSGSFFTLDVSNRLNEPGDTISLKDTSGAVMDLKTYFSGIPGNVSIGRNPDGTGNWINCTTSSKDSSNNLLCI